MFFTSRYFPLPTWDIFPHLLIMRGNISHVKYLMKKINQQSVLLNLILLKKTKSTAKYSTGIKIKGEDCLRATEKMRMSINT